MRAIAATASLGLGVLLGGCASVVPGEWTGSRTYIGMVRVEMQPTVGDMQIIDVRTLGLAAGRSGVMLGWEQGSWVIADPAQCQLVVIIRSPTEAENAARVLRELRGQRACLVNETDGS